MIVSCCLSLPCHCLSCGFRPVEGGRGDIASDGLTSFINDFFIAGVMSIECTASSSGLWSPDLPTSRTSGLRNRLEGVFCLLSRGEGVIQFTVRRDEMEV
jgi:hypothetical protein